MTISGNFHFAILPVMSIPGIHAENKSLKAPGGDVRGIVGQSYNVVVH